MTAQSVLATFGIVSAFVAGAVTWLKTLLMGWSYWNTNVSAQAQSAIYQLLGIVIGIVTSYIVVAGGLAPLPTDSTISPLLVYLILGFVSAYGGQYLDVGISWIYGHSTNVLTQSVETTAQITGGDSALHLAANDTAPLGRLPWLSVRDHVVIQKAQASRAA